MNQALSAYEQDAPTGNGGLFPKWESGKTYRLRVLDLPVVFGSEYEGKLSTKYAWPVYNHDAGEVQILQKGAQVYKGILALVQDEEYGDPVQYDIKLSVEGTGKDTKYTVTPARESKEVPTDIEIPDVAAILSKNERNFDVRKIGEAQQQASKPKDTVLEDIDDKPIDLDAIPF